MRRASPQRAPPKHARFSKATHLDVPLITPRIAVEPPPSFFRFELPRKFLSVHLKPFFMHWKPGGANGETRAKSKGAQEEGDSRAIHLEHGGLIQERRRRLLFDGALERADHFLHGNRKEGTAIRDASEAVMPFQARAQRAGVPFSRSRARLPVACPACQ